MARLQPHRLGDNHPDARDRQALRGSGRVLETLHDGLGQGLHRVAPTGQDRKTAGDGQPLGGLGPPPLECGLRSRRPPLGPETPARMAPPAVGQPEPVGGLLASRVPHGPLRLWGDVPLGPHAQA
jgi:hypothetical protein